MEKLLVTLIIASSCLALTEAKFEVDLRASFGANQDSYNVGEDVLMVCNLQANNENPSIGYKMKWYKRQGGNMEFKMIGRDENVLEEPFTNLNKYKITYVPDRNNYQIAIYLNITGVEAVDIGDYKCAAGYDGEDYEDSNTVSLNVNPGTSVILTLVTNAIKPEGKYEFNNAASVSCRGQANSLSDDLSLVVKLEDGTVISNDFTKTSNIEWTGEEGLKLPTSFYRLDADSWKPNSPGDNQMSCYFQHGDRQLAIKTFTFTKVEKATIQCTSNAKEIRVDDLNVVITCSVSQYSEPMDDVTVRWKFISEGENATLNNGKRQHLRRTENNGKEYKLIIPIITKDMVSTGKFFNYDVELYRKDNEETVAETTFSFTVDSRGRIENKAAPTYYTGSLLVALTSGLLLVAGHL